MTNKKGYSRKQLVFIALNPPAWVFFAARAVWLGIVAANPIKMFQTYTKGAVLILSLLPVLLVSAVSWDIANKVKPQYVRFTDTYKRYMKPFLSEYQKEVYVASFLVHVLFGFSLLVYHFLGTKPFQVLAVASPIFLIPSAIAMLFYWDTSRRGQK